MNKPLIFTPVWLASSREVAIERRNNAERFQRRLFPALLAILAGTTYAAVQILFL